ncbi:protein translocase subunit SecF [Protofrankia coriariae]|uniref:Protein-export membrane protein SecF n=1 Tax=Protofrankia coriariae TaxID=1562887 RepID=A0ABR5F400_9ACTN|nr:protein translocase subunit SecF [Protofrankia coriariae]KLL11455.1 preprotein translocase subunit SecF [Protofrankia coriariae]
MSWASRLYRNQSHVDFVGRRRIWYAFSAFLLIVCVASMLIRGFSLGIDFKGGALFQFPSGGRSVAVAEEALSSAGVNPADSVIQELDTSQQLRVQTPTLSAEQASALQNTIEKRFEVAPTDIDISTVGASWGSTITSKALQGLAVFLVLVMVYLSVRFEWKMAVAAMTTLIHDLVITMGVYSLVGFQVTPSTVIALLAILGFSLYDTVVVFDRVRENTAGMSTTSRRTYAEATNDALNETLMRSLNTSFIALVPVASLLFVGAGLLGAGTLEDLALAQFVGIASGAYSSLFFATPLLVDLKKNEPAVRALDQRVARVRAAAAREPARQPRAAAAAAVGGRVSDSGAAAAGQGPGSGFSDTATTPSDADERERGEPASGREPAVAGVRPPRPAAGRRPTPARRSGRKGRPSGKKRR